MFAVLHCSFASVVSFCAVFHVIQFTTLWAYLIKLSRSKHANLRRRYNDDGIMANSSARYSQPDKCESTFKNWKRNWSSHSKRLSLSLQRDCHIRIKYTSHCTNTDSFWILVCLGLGSGQASLLSRSQSRSSIQSSSQTSGSCSSLLSSSACSCSSSA